MYGRESVSEPQWTRVRPSLNHKSVIDYVVTDIHLMRESGSVQIDSTDIGASDHFQCGQSWVGLLRGVGNKSV